MTMLEFRGLDLLTGSPTSSGIHLDLTRGFLLPAHVRGEDTLIPARAGRISGNRVADTLDLLLEGYVRGNSITDWRSATDDLMAAITEGGADPGALIVRDPYMGLDGQHATIYCRVTDATSAPPVAFRFQAWSIALESIDPDWVVEDDV